jgi:putative addiction module killer protein
MEIREAEAFSRWLAGLKDVTGRAKIQVRIDRLQRGNPGDVAPVGEGVSEMRIDYGPGYRVYFVQRGAALVLLLGGGTKKTQAKDIEVAKAMARKR